MTHMTADVEKLKGLIVKRAAEDAAKVEDARGEYAESLAKVEALNAEALQFVEDHLAESFSTGASRVKDTDAHVSTSKSGRNVSIEVRLPESITLTRNGSLPFNPDGEGVTDEDIASALGTQTPEFHARTLEVLDVAAGKSIDIDTAQFGYYL